MVRTRRRAAAIAALALAAGAAASAAVALLVRDGRRFDGAVVVLLEDNTLVTLDGTGNVVGRIHLGRPAPEPIAGRYLALAGPLALRAVVSEQDRDRLAFVELGDLGVRRRALPPGVRFRALEVGPRTGRLYLAGERSTTLRSEFGGFVQAAVLSVLSADARELASATLRAPRAGESRSGPLDWRVYDIAVAPDERHAFVSYHGPNTGGADGVAVAGGRLERCTPRAPTEACVERVHGTIEPEAEGILATLGTPPTLGRFTRDGRHVRSWRTGFAQAHLMEFARRERLVFTLETCTKTGGMTLVDLERRRAEVLHRPVPAGLDGITEEKAVCGERISTGRDGLIAVMKRGTITDVAGVLLLDADGRLIRWVPLRPAPVDVLVLP